jgi:histidinol-phosphate/aromatic aminotransferase/cobyric acid decarboxylase-like protein
MYCLEYNPEQKAFHIDKLESSLIRNVKALTGDCNHWVMIAVGEQEEMISFLANLNEHNNNGRENQD